MAQFYTGPHFWTEEQYEVTACGQPGRYTSRSMFIESVNTWMIKNDISFKWSGESTHERDGVKTYYYHVKIFDDHERTLFALRWS